MFKKLLFLAMAIGAILLMKHMCPMCQQKHSAVGWHKHLHKM